MTNYPYHLSITGILSNNYQELQQGKTEATCIVGYADCASGYYNNIYPVYDIVDALETFQGASGIVGSLQRGLLEAYYGGCRDIYLLPIGDMDEYTPFEDGRPSGFYITQDAKYIIAADILKDADEVDIFVPVDADPTIDTSITIFG